MSETENLTMKDYFAQKKIIKEKYKSCILSYLQAIKDCNANDEMSKEEKQEFIKDTKQSLKDCRKEKRKELMGLEKPFPMKCMILFVLVILVCVLYFEVYNIKNYKNYQNEYFAFRYNENMVYIDDYTEIADMWVVTTGGGIYAPTLIMIGYVEDYGEMELSAPLYKLQEVLGGIKSEETIDEKNNLFKDDYILKMESGATYKILSKSIRKNGGILTVMFVNAGELNEKEQAYLYEVYSSIMAK